MGQQPNVPLQMEDLPRPELDPAPARRWVPQRPGDLSGPGESRWGGAYGTPGPDSGYALSLLAGSSEGRDADTTAALAVLMMARASHFGRAPTSTDSEVAEAVLGLAGGSAPGGAAEVVRGVARSARRARELLEAVDLGVLTGEPAPRASGGEAAAGS